MTTTVGIVTGAARGMGAACARRVAANVDLLLLADRDTAGATALAAELRRPGLVVEGIDVDVTDATSVAALAARASDAGCLRAVVHAAGISPTMGPGARIWDVNLAGTARMIDAVRPLVVSGTAMVCFASTAGHMIGANGNAAIEAVMERPLVPDFVARVLASAPGLDDPAAAYTWSKLGVLRLVRREALVWGPRGGRIVSVSPGIIDTPMGRQEHAQQPMMQTLVDMTPLRRQGTADEVADVVAFLLSDAASFVTGTDVLVDGGSMASLDPPPAS